MALSDSMFLFEIVILSLKSYVCSKNFKIIDEFADLFKVYLKSPTVRPKNVKQRDKLKKSNRDKVSQSIFIIHKSFELISLMKKHPLKIIISKDDEAHRNIGSTIIPWSNEYINYLTKDNNMKSVFPPAYTERKYNVYNELTSKRIATINMSLKLTCLKDKITSQFRSISNKFNQLMDTGEYNMMNNERLIFTSAKPLVSVSKFSSNNVEKVSYESILLKSKSLKNINKSKEQYNGCNKSDLDIQGYNNTIDSVKSCSSIDYKQKNNLFRYIFGDPMMSFGNKVYQVGYFTVETDVSGQSSPKVTSGVQSSEKSVESKKEVTFKKCGSECLSKTESGICQHNICTFNLPEEATHVTSVTKCKEVTCDFKKHRELPPPSDDRVLLDLTSLKTVCCSEVTEEVISGVITKMKIGHDPCFCSCECGLFSSKKTTYCTICGGYEIPGDDVTGKAVHETLMPCPIFHKLIDKNKLKTWSTSGSESKKKGDDQRSIRSLQKATTERRPTVVEKKSVESEKSKKKKKDDRFKFNYGYKAPQIGHSQCALPCTGTLDNVPKRMGWLWSAENVPGMKVSHGWKPGAISNKLLRMLNKAKSHKSTAETVKRTKRTKKQVEDKPALIVCKQNGHYHVELQATPENPDEFPDQCTPVIYKIESVDNRVRLKKKAKIQERLIEAAITEVWSDPHDLEACENVCLPAYKQAVGSLPESADDRMVSEKHTDDSNSCSCDEEEISSSCDSSEVDWEIHFTPPYVSHQKTTFQEKNNELVL